MELSTFIGAGTVKLFHDGEDVDDAYDYLRKVADPVTHPTGEWGEKEDVINFPGPLSHSDNFELESKRQIANLNYRRILNALLETKGDYSVHLHTAEGEFNGQKESVQRLLSAWGSEDETPDKIETQATIPHGDDEVTVPILIDRPEDWDGLTAEEAKRYVEGQIENQNFEVKR